MGTWHSILWKFDLVGRTRQEVGCSDEEKREGARDVRMRYQSALCRKNDVKRRERRGGIRDQSMLKKLGTIGRWRWRWGREGNGMIDASISRNCCCWERKIERRERRGGSRDQRPCREMSAFGDIESQGDGRKKECRWDETRVRVKMKWARWNWLVQFSALANGPVTDGW